MKTVALRLTAVCILCLFFSGPAHSTPLPRYISDEIIVKFKAETPRHLKKRLWQHPPVKQVRGSYQNRFYTLKIEDGTVKETVEKFSQNPDIEYAIPNYILRACGFPDDPYYPEQYNFQMTFIEDAWQVSTGEGVVVAVIDSGISPYGQDGFKHRLLDGFNGFWGIENLWIDKNSHGTHVAGTIGQETNNAIGVAGIAFDAFILPVKALNRLGAGTTAAVASAIFWAADNGADIINLSLGSDSGIIEPIEEALKYAYTRNIVIIAASGNSSTEEDLRALDYPASSRYTIAVGAVNREKTREFYSNGGRGLDIVAPGNRIAQEAFFRFFGFEWFALGWGIWGFSGTSMAAAHVSGVAALMKSIHPEWGHEEIRNVLINTAMDLGKPGWDEEYGYGLVDAFSAVTFFQR